MAHASSFFLQENAERVLKEQKRLERQREIEEKRRSLAVCTPLDLGPSNAREPHSQENQDELEKLLEKNLSYSWSRRNSRSSDARKNSHQLQNDAHLHNSLLKIFPELASSPTSKDSQSNSSSDQDTTAEHRVSSPDTDGACSPTEQDSSARPGGLCQYGRATNRRTDVARDSPTSASRHSQRGQDFAVKRHGPDRVSYVLQSHQSMGPKKESENPRGHVVLNHQTLPTSCTNSASLPTETSSKVDGQPPARGQSFGLMVMDKALATERKTNDANFESAHRSSHSGEQHSHVESEAQLSRRPRCDSQTPLVTDRAHNFQHQIGETIRTSSGAMPDASLQMHSSTEAATTPVKENWFPSSLPDFEKSEPEGFADLPNPEPEMERSYSRVGETVECHTLVKGLRSYDVLSPPTSPLPRPAPSLCSKWRKEREGDLREGTSPGSPTSKEDVRSVKTPARSGIGAKRGPSNSTGVLRTRSKNEASHGIQTSANSSSRLASPRSTAVRSSVVTRAAAAQSEVKCISSTQERAANKSQTTGKSTLTRRMSERSLPEKPAGGTQQAFVRGSLFRVSKRLAPNPESQVTPQPRNAHSPSSATAKTIRTTVVSGARNKTAKTTSTSASPASSKSTTVSRIPGPKVPRATAPQPMWRWWK